MLTETGSRANGEIRSVRSVRIDQAAEKKPNDKADLELSDSLAPVHLTLRFQSVGRRAHESLDAQLIPTWPSRRL